MDIITLIFQELQGPPGDSLAAWLIGVLLIGYAGCLALIKSIYEKRIRDKSAAIAKRDNRIGILETKIDEVTTARLNDLERIVQVAQEATAAIRSIRPSGN